MPRVVPHLPVARCLTCGQAIPPMPHRSARGNCTACHSKYVRAIRAGKTTWARLEAEGKACPALTRAEVADRSPWRRELRRQRRLEREP